MGGVLLAVAGWTDVALFYLPPRFGSPEWEFAIVSQTFDAMPLPTLGLLLIVLGLRARGTSLMWTRSMAVVLGLVAFFCLAALGLYALDVPLAVKSVQRAGAGPNAQAAAVMAFGLERAIAKATLFGVCYLAAYTWMATMLWRVRRGAGQAT